MELGAWLALRVAGRPIAATRILLALALGISSVESSAMLFRLTQGAMRYPLFDWVPPPSEVLPAVVLVGGLAASLCLCVGLLPHVAASLGSGLCLLVLLADQQTYSSHLTLLTVLLGLLAFSQSEREWGVSERWRAGTSGVPFWPQLLMMTQVSVVYLFAGLSKAQPTFLSGEPLSEWMTLALPPWLFQVLAWGTVTLEVGLALALWAPKLRAPAMVAGVALHLSILLFLGQDRIWLAGFALTTLATYPLFLSRPSIPAREGVVGHPS